MAESFQEQVLAHVKCSHAALDAANAALEKEAAQKVAAAALIPAAVDALVKNDRIDPAQREKAAQLLADPVQVLQILIKTADPANTVKARPIGAPAEKTASAVASTVNPNYCGQRTSEKRASDIAYENRLLGRS